MAAGFATWLVVVVCACTITEQTVDLNLGQLQYVSDHLTIKECKRLITALHQNKFQLSPKDIRPDKGKKPCLYLLTEWNRSSKDSSVEDLTVRLHQIGRTDIARYIAQAVYGETAREIHKYFLDNPFHDMASRPNSRLIEDDEKEEAKQKTLTSVDYLRGAVTDRGFCLAVVALTLTMTCMAMAVIRAYCPGACATMCPDRLWSTVEAMQESMAESIKTLKSLTVLEMSGKKTKRADPPKSDKQREEQQRLVESFMDVSNYPQQA